VVQYLPSMYEAKFCTQHGKKRKKGYVVIFGIKVQGEMRMFNLFLSKLVAKDSLNLGNLCWI
jgi:hypothetical protein